MSPYSSAVSYQLVIFRVTERQNKFNWRDFSKYKNQVLLPTFNMHILKIVLNIMFLREFSSTCYSAKAPQSIRFSNEKTTMFFIRQKNSKILINDVVTFSLGWSRWLKYLYLFNRPNCILLLEGNMVARCCGECFEKRCVPNFLLERGGKVRNNLI